MPRNLNARQMQFAAKVAGGKSLVGAYREVYQPNGKMSGVYQNAKRAARHPGVREVIEKMKLQLLPDPGEAKALLAHAKGVLVQLSLDAKDEKVRLMAAERLREVAVEELEELERRGMNGNGGDLEIVAELRALYAKALPGAEPLVLEASESPGEE